MSKQDQVFISPKPLAINPDSIPDEVKSLPQWVLWRYDSDGRKMPYQVNGQPAKINDATTWTSFAEAYNEYKKPDSIWSGLWFALTDNDPFVALDIDKMKSLPNDKLKIAREVIEKFNSYTERSPSGNGIHVIVKGKTLDDYSQRNDLFEFYSQKRFMSFTGQVISKTKSIENRQPEIEWFQQTHLKKKSEPIDIPSTPSNLTDQEILDLCRNVANRDKFKRLFDEGNMNEYLKADNTPDKSSADAGLASMLAFYTQDVNQIIRLMNRSRLKREKWNRPDYLPRTINSIISNQKEKYMAKQPSNEKPAEQKYGVAGNTNPFSAQMSVDNFMAIKTPEPEWIIPGFVAKNILTFLWAAGGTGKSHFLYALLRSLTKTGEWQGQPIKKQRVFLCNRDMSIGLVKKRMKNWGLDTYNEYLKIFHREICPPLTDLEAWRQLPSTETDIVVIDSLGSATESIGMKHDDIYKQILALCKDLAEKGPQFIVLHNTRKDGQDSKGIAEISDRADIEYEVRDATGFDCPFEDWFEEFMNFTEGDNWRKLRQRRRKDRTKFSLCFNERKERFETIMPVVYQISSETIPWSIKRLDFKDDPTKAYEMFKRKESAERQKAKQFLETLITVPGKMYPAAEIVEMAVDRGIKKGVLYDVRSELGIETAGGHRGQPASWYKPKQKSEIDQILDETN